MTNDRTILITGVTGNQGRAAAYHRWRKASALKYSQGRNPIPCEYSEPPHW